MKLTIQHIRQEAEAIKTIRLSIHGKNFSFLPGQSLAININDPKNNIPEQKRYYSIASSPHQTHYLELLIKDNPKSLVGHYLYEHLTPGDELDVEGPYGNMILPASNVQRVTLIAAGSGIAPLMSITRYLQEKNQNAAITLFYSTKTSSEIAFLDELEDLKHKKTFSYIHTITQDPHWNGNKGRITKNFLEKNLPSKEGVFFICGPTDMIKDTVTNLKELGVKENAIILEKY